MSYTYQQIIDAVEKGEAQITFTKKDGTERVMRCVRRLENFDKRDVEMEAGTIVTVWDLDKNGYRCIRVDSVKSIND